MIYIISGFMRSGTSMLCAALEAGGMQVVKTQERDNFATVHSDELYKVNPSGLYEPKPSDIEHIQQYENQVVKVVVPWLRMLPVHQYSIVFMLRHPEEIRQSFEAAFGGKLKNIEATRAEALKQLANRRDVCQIITLNYREVVDDPLTELGKIPWQFDKDKAAATINPALCRFRLERLTIGI